MNRLKWIVIGALLCLFSEAGAAGKDWVKYVNTLQGTNSSFELSRGNTYPAVAMPWGMNFWTPQTGENRNGFIYRYAEDIIRGFRQTHQCSPWANDYAAFSLMPVSGELKVTQHNRFRHFRHEDEIAQPHYYKVTLDNRITAEMSPTERGVFMRFTYPEGKDAYVVLDLNKSHNKIKIIPEQRKVVGYTTHASQAVPQGYANYFVIVFDQPIEGYGTWTTDEGKIRPGVAEEEGFFVSGYLKFAPGGQVNARVVSSFISEEQAEENFRQELAGVKDLEEVKAELSEWENQKEPQKWKVDRKKIKLLFIPVCIIRCCSRVSFMSIIRPENRFIIVLMTGKYTRDICLQTMVFGILSGHNFHSIYCYIPKCTDVT